VRKKCEKSLPYGARAGNKGGNAMPHGRTSKVLDLLNAIMEIAEERHPVTVRGICYALVEVHGLIPSMEKRYMNRIGTHVRELREPGRMPWEWIVDETRTEGVSRWI
jgi:hypothetical protein